MRRTTLALAAVLIIAGSRALMAQSEAPVTPAPEDTTATDRTPTERKIVAPEPEHPRAGQGAERHGRRKHRRYQGEGAGVRTGGGGETRRPKPSGGGDAPKPNR